ncbi:MAG: efflux RND transporter periplasmic adaptor subunit [Gemmatimonadota bacterium]
MRTIRVNGAALLAAAILTACGGGEAAGPPPPQVTVTKPERRDVQRFAEFTGNTRAIEYAEIRARVSGTLEEMRFVPARFVEENDVLFIIEPDVYQAAFDEAQAFVAAARSELARAESDLERIQQAIQTNAVSRQDLDRAQATRDQADAAVLGAQARLDQATIDLGYTRVRTPIPGQVSRNFVDLGNLVGAGEATLLTTVTRIDPIFVYFDVPERAVLRLTAAQRDTTLTEEQLARVGQVLVATAEDRGFPHQGKVDFIDNTVNPATGTIEARALVANAENILFPGLFVRLRVLGAIGRDAILVHERAIGTDLGGKYVLLVRDDNVVEQRYVVRGPVQDDGTVVIEEGLDGSESYIVNGMLRARPGFPVTPQTEAEVAAMAQTDAEGN